MLLALLLLSSQNLVVNGDFETNSSTGCDFNLTNATFSSKMSGCTGYGPQNEIDIMDGGCGYGPTGPAGSTKIGVANNGDPSVDALTMTLTGPLTVGKTYTIKMYLYAHIESWAPVQLPIEVGLSTVAGAQGTVVATLTPTVGVFTQVSATFTAGVAASYLSVSAAPFFDGWTHIDGVELTGGFTLTKTGTCAGPVGLTTTGGTGGGAVALLYGNPGSSTKPSGVCAGTTVSLAQPTLAAVITANAAGTAALGFNAPAGACGRTIQAVDLVSCSVSNTVVL